MGQTCCICGQVAQKELLTLTVEEQSGSQLYESIAVVECLGCRHVFNLLSEAEYKDLKSTYSGVYTSKSLGKVYGIGDVPGSTSDMSRVRYQEIIDVLFRNVSLTKKEKILDIGCAQGGFLNELANLGFSDLYGVDVSKKFIEQANKNLKSAKFVVGEAASLPFSDSSFDVVIIDQVLEHLLEPQLAIAEIERVLKVDGYLLVGVPDAEYYEKFSFFSYYWFLIKEHIQHFGINAIFNLVTNRDFDYINHDTRISHMNSYTQPFPNLITLFKKTNGIGANQRTSLSSSLKQLEINSYLAKNRKLHIRLNERIRRDVNSHQEIYVWGIGKEFFFIMSQTPLKNYTLKGLIDSNIQSFKKKHFRGLQISQPAILKRSSTNSLLIIAATAHTENIRHELEMIGFKGDILEF